MRNQKKILCMVGTRPEVIKMAPVILTLQNEPWACVRIVATAQHRDMLDDALEIFEISPDIDLNIMQSNQTLSDLTARLLTRLDKVLSEEKPDMVIAQGDTTTVMCTALACFYQNTPFAHVEAGLRTGDIRNPFPEEMNRIMAGRLASLHFAPTQRAKEALLAEGVDPNDIYMTGNTVIDSLVRVSATKPDHGLALPNNKRLILLTAHRRENFGAPIREIFKAVNTLTERYPDIHFIYPIHPNPNVSEPAYDILGKNSHVTLCHHLDYRKLIAILNAVDIVLTDSGGIQEEAPALGKPVLVLRQETERPEAIEAGVASLIGTDHDAIVEAASILLTNPEEYRRMSQKTSPYGDGHAAERIVNILSSRLN